MLSRSYQLISVDLFDTLLVRTKEKPIHIFQEVWVQAQKEHITNSDLTALEFQMIRVEAEHRARAKHPANEVNLSAIYAEIPCFLTTNKQRFQEIELEVELNNCYVNFYFYDWLLEQKKNGIPIILTSDMYFSKAELIQLMQHNGICVDLFEAIFISNEYHCSKQQGGLFQVVLQHYPKLKPEQIIHIGDNKTSDIQQAKKYGLQTFHYNAIPPVMGNLYDYERILHATPLEEILSLRKLVCYAWEQQEQKNKAMLTTYTIGASILGPVLTFFIAHVCKRLKELSIHRIYPFMREGALYGKLLENEAQRQQYLLEVKPIYISRKVTYVASIQTINREEIENLIGIRNVTIEEAFVMLGFQKESFSELTEFYNTRFKESHLISYNNMTLKEYVIQRLLEPQNKEKIMNYVSEQKQLLFDYLTQEIGNFEKIATLDMGCLGRVQTWFESCLKQYQIPYQIKHFIMMGTTGTKLCDGLDIEGYFGTTSDYTGLLTPVKRSIDIVEKMISVTSGSTIGYKRSNGKISPICSDPVNNQTYTKLFFEGIEQFQKAFFYFREQKPDIAMICIEEKRIESLKLLHRLIDLPLKQEAEILSSLEADTNFGTNYKATILTEANKTLFNEKGIDFIDRCNISYTYQNSNIVWPKGLITLYDEFYYVRKAMKEQTKNSITRTMQELVEHVKQEGVQTVALYGAGENGSQLHFICQLYGIDVFCFIDRKESLWGTFKEGVPIMSLAHAMEQGISSYIIASLFSIHEIQCYLEESFQGLETKPRIFSV